jgi:hypothetical protein
MFAVIVGGMPSTSAKKPVRSYRAHGRRVRSHRENLPDKPSQAECARRAGFDANWWTKLENGKVALRDHDNRKRVATALGLDLESFDVLWGRSPKRRRRRGQNQPGMNHHGHDVPRRGAAQS